MTEAPALVLAAGANMTPPVNCGRADELGPWFEETPDGAALILRSPRGPGFSAPRGTASDDVMFIPGSFDVVDLGAGELGLSGCTEVTCSWVASVHQLLKGTLATVCRDVLQPAQVSPKMEKKTFFT
jgi:hypothetical protein